MEQAYSSQSSLRFSSDSFFYHQTLSEWGENNMKEIDVIACILYAHES